MKKTKILVFGQVGKTSATWYYNDNPLEQVTSYRYLGIIFHQNGMFNEATEALSKSALKVMNMIFVMSRECGGFSCDTLRSLFTALVQPVLEYGSEIWGLREFLIMERTVLKYCKKMLGLPFTATNNAVYGETGRLPLWIRTQYRVMKFWNRLHGEVPSLVKEALTVSKQLQTSWASGVRRLLQTYGVVDIGSILFENNFGNNRYQLE